MSLDRPHLEPIASVRAELAEPLAQALAPIGDEVVVAIRDSIPEYAKPLEGNFGRNVRRGVDEALRRFVADIRQPSADPEAWRSLYFELGRGELGEGRTLEALLGAYRIGARVSWRGIAAAAEHAGATQAELAALAEAIFAYIDEISAFSAEGYASAQAARAGDSQRRRNELVALLADPTASPATVEMAAERASWEIPASAAALVLAAEHAGRVAPRLGDRALVGALGEGFACAVIADPAAPGRRRGLEVALGEWPAALGPGLSIGEFSRSLERARLAFELQGEGLLPAASPLLVEEHLPELVTLGDRALLAELAERELSGLKRETEASRTRLIETLAAWIEHPARPTEVARAVHVHPQTARYRLARLRELIGDIDDPERRFALGLALRYLRFPSARPI